MSCKNWKLSGTILKPKPERWRTVANAGQFLPRDATQARKPWKSLSYMLANKLSSPIMPAIAIVKWWKKPTPLTRK